MDLGTCNVFRTDNGTYGWKYEAATGAVRSMIGSGFMTEQEARMAMERTLFHVHASPVEVP